MDGRPNVPLHHSTYVVAHCETTGIDPDADAVYDVALVRWEGGEPIDRLGSLVFPELALPAAVLRSCAISNIDVADKPTLDDLMPQLRAFAGGDPIIAHDVEIAQAFLGGISERTDWLSVVELAPRAWQFNFSRDFSARGLIEHADLEEHRTLLGSLPLNRAEGEAVMTGLVMRELLEEFEGLGYGAIGDLHQFIGRRRPETWLSCRPYHDRIANLPEHVLRWVLRDAAKPPRLRCMHPSKDALYAIKVHLEAYRNWSIPKSPGLTAGLSAS